MANDKHIVVGKPHHRVVDDDDQETVTAMETFSVGDEIEPTDAELSAFPDRFEPAGNLDPSASDNTGGEGGENGAYSPEDIDAMSYDEKRRVASGVEGVDGRGSDEEITQGLKDHFSTDDSDDDSGFGEE